MFRWSERDHLHCTSIPCPRAIFHPHILDHTLPDHRSLPEKHDMHTRPKVHARCWHGTHNLLDRHAPPAVQDRSVHIDAKDDVSRGKVANRLELAVLGSLVLLNGGWGFKGILLKSSFHFENFMRNTWFCSGIFDKTHIFLEKDAENVRLKHILDVGRHINSSDALVHLFKEGCEV